MPARSDVFTHYLGGLKSNPLDTNNDLRQFFMSAPECLSAVDNTKNKYPTARIRMWTKEPLGNWCSTDQMVF